MKILLDECLPVRLSRLLSGYEVQTVRQLNLLGLSNGKLLAAAEPMVDVFLTVDKNIVHQQQLTGNRLAIVVLRARSNTLDDLSPLMDQVHEVLQKIQPGQMLTIGPEPETSINPST